MYLLIRGFHKWQVLRLKHLHPTMYLLILVYRLTDALVCLHLHPTMYLLIQSAGADPAERGT